MDFASDVSRSNTFSLTGDAISYAILATVMVSIHFAVIIKILKHLLHNELEN